MERAAWMMSHRAALIFIIIITYISGRGLVLPSAGARMKDEENKRS
jgi:hypothetical protein